MYMHYGDRNLMPVFAECINREILCDLEFPYSFILNGKSYISMAILEKTHRNKIDIIFVDRRCNEDTIEYAKKLLAPDGRMYNKENSSDVIPYYKKCIEERNNSDAVILDVGAVTEEVARAVIELNDSDSGRRKFLMCTNCKGINLLYVKTAYLIEKNENASINLKYFDQHLIEISEERRKFENCFKLYVDELVNLENHCEKFSNVVTILNNMDADFLINRNMSKRTKLYLWENVTLSERHRRIIKEKNITVIKIPEYFFEK